MRGGPEVKHSLWVPSGFVLVTMQAGAVRKADAQGLQPKLERIKRSYGIPTSLAPSFEGIACMFCSTGTDASLQVWSEHTVDPEWLPRSELISPISDLRSLHLRHPEREIPVPCWRLKTLPTVLKLYKFSKGPQILGPWTDSLQECFGDVASVEKWTRAGGWGVKQAAH